MHMTKAFLYLSAIVTQHAVQARNTTDFNYNWLFHYGDASGADATSYDDGSWRKLNVPHDWAIEGPSPPASPFRQDAATLGYGGYAPSGIGWYRKHFNLGNISSGQRVYIEFDGVMNDGSYYVNGQFIAKHPYAYTSVRYDITSAVSLTGPNVIAVKTDTSIQPGERFYRGAGIFRDVRLVSTDAVHVDQYGLYVSSTNVSTSSAVVKAQTTVLNSGSTSASVSVTSTLKDGANTVGSPVTANSQVIAAGARATFTVNIPVSNPKLWDTVNPNLYSLAASVSVNNAVVDTTSANVGIRSIVFDAKTGMTLNGKNTKFKGVCLHQDLHGLGMASNKAAYARRLAKLKTLGVNAVRTAHETHSPVFLDLADSLGFLVLAEFFDVWTKHKYTNVGDYAKDFNNAPSGATGGPDVPDASGSLHWYEVDVTNAVSRDRNHPSVALWSTGNEIHDSISVRTPILTRIKAIVNKLDPSRLVTQALLQPEKYGDITGATRTIVDVFGGNYRDSEVASAMAMSPPRAGLVTEQTTDTKYWSDITSNPALTGLFMWTGWDYLGEANGSWPLVGNDQGIVDAVGTVKSIGYQWQTIFGAPKTSPAKTGTTASKLVVAAERTSVTSDVNDIVYVQATVADSSGGVVTSSSAPITFSISGPGVIVAVDSGNLKAETFRGNVRNAYEGIAFALVRATGAGQITVSASANGLTAGKATFTGSVA